MNVREESSASDAVRAELGQRIKERREKLGLSQTALGERLTSGAEKAVAGTQISKWERGEHLPDRRYWPQLAGALNLEFGDLLSTEGSTLALTRVEEVSERLEALIRVLGMADAVDSAVRAGRLSPTPDLPEEEQDAAEVERELAAADRAEQERAQRDEQECETTDPQSSQGDRPTGS